MTRTVLAGGTPLQLWKVRRLYAELYPAWPSMTPSEVWTKEILSYELPAGKLGSCLDGSLTLQLDTRLPLPGGFVRPSGFGVRCTLVPFSRLVQIIAVLPNGDELVFHRGVLGLVRTSGENTWGVQLLGPDAILRDSFSAGQSLPTGAPYAAPARIYGSYTLPPSSGGGNMTFGEWWQAALAPYPDAELGVGPDLAWLAGRPSLVPGAGNYALDARAQDVASQGREVPPYLTHLRRAVPGTFELASNHVTRSGVGPFVPRRVASVSGSVVTAVTDGGGPWSGGFQGGSGSISGTNLGFSGTFYGSAPAQGEGMALVSAQVSISLNLALNAGRAVITADAQGQDSAGSYRILKETRYEVTRGGSWTFSFEFSPQDMAGLNGCQARVLVLGVTDDAAGSGSVGNAGGSYKYTETTETLTYEPDPPGLNYPLYTDESWTLRLPGLHRGPLAVSGLPDSGPQYATTVVRVNADEGVWSELRCGPLPYQEAPVQARPGNTFFRARGKAHG